MDALKPQRNEPARMEMLAKLPVFWGLKGKRVVLAGGSDGAAWKAELLLACGAQLDLYCEERALSESLATLTAKSPMLTWHDRCWDADIFKGAELALADCETEEEAGRFYDTARAAGVPVNVIDKPEFCQFQFGSIVNRSPVVVAISTDGAAPILAQAIRRRIETLLPLSLKDWGALAQAIRERVNLRFAPGAPRRSFWEKFVDRAFTERLDEGIEEKLLTDMGMQAGRVGSGRGLVTLVGAGPGDAELLTLKAVRALQAADIILFDDLVSAEVLELARREAKRMLVGKRGGRETGGTAEIRRSDDFRTRRRGDRGAGSRKYPGRGRAWHHRRKRHGLTPRRFPDASRPCPVGPVRHRTFAAGKAAGKYRLAIPVEFFGDHRVLYGRANRRGHPVLPARPRHARLDPRGGDDFRQSGE